MHCYVGFCLIKEKKSFKSFSNTQQQKHFTQMLLMCLCMHHLNVHILFIFSLHTTYKWLSECMNQWMSQQNSHALFLRNDVFTSCSCKCQKLPLLEKSTSFYTHVNERQWCIYLTKMTESHPLHSVVQSLYINLFSHHFIVRYLLLLPLK